MLFVQPVVVKLLVHISVSNEKARNDLIASFDQKTVCHQIAKTIKQIGLLSSKP